LSEKSEPLTYDQTKQEGFKERLRNLHETLLHFRGVGLSAIQVDWPVRLFAMRTPKEVQTFVNPEIVTVDGDEAEREEGCLSLPGVFERVKRFPNVIVAAMDLQAGERRLWDLEGIEAQCAQHEVDHLDGKMFSDNYGSVKRDIVRRKIKKQLRINPLFGVE
jgi:peptide deformylase